MRDVSWITCATAGCGYSPFPLEKSFEERARRTHEGFYCPAGHSLAFKGESRQEKEHRLEVEELQREVARWRGHWRSEHALARTCPWPTCREYVYSTRDSLYDHMRRAHGMPTLALVKESA